MRRRMRWQTGAGPWAKGAKALHHLERSVRFGNENEGAGTYWIETDGDATMSDEAFANYLDNLPRERDAAIRRAAYLKCAEIAERHEGKPCRHAEGWTDAERDAYDSGQVDATISLAARFRQMAEGSGE